MAAKKSLKKVTKKKVEPEVEPVASEEEAWKPFRRFNGVLTPRKCDGIISKYGDKVTDAQVVNEDSSNRVAEGHFFQNNDLYDVVESVFLKYHEEVAPIDWDGYEPLHLIRYGFGGKYDWHLDNELLPEDNRKLTCVIALNSAKEYNGGGLEIAWPTGRNIHRFHDLRAGDAVVFPSILLHRGVPVTRDYRWILVAWALGGQYR